MKRKCNLTSNTCSGEQHASTTTTEGLVDKRLVAVDRERVRFRPTECDGKLEDRLNRRKPAGMIQKVGFRSNRPRLLFISRCLADVPILVRGLTATLPHCHTATLPHCHTATLEQYW